MERIAHDPEYGALSERQDGLARRRRVWTALAELFLDTQLDAKTFAWIALRLRQNGCSAREARQILVDEVAPVFVGNLLVTAGQWSGWREADVEEAILAFHGRGALRRLLLRTAARVSRGLYWRDWREVERRLETLEPAPGDASRRDPS